MKKLLISFFALVAFASVGMAQKYRGFVYDDIPALLEIKAVNGKELAYIKIVGQKKGWSGLSVKREHNIVQLHREKDSESVEFPIFMMDVSKDCNLPAKSVYLGQMRIENKDGTSYYKQFYFLRDDIE
jgi:hypothetical protein